MVVVVVVMNLVEVMSFAKISGGVDFVDRRMVAQRRMRRLF